MLVRLVPVLVCFFAGCATSPSPIYRDFTENEIALEDVVTVFLSGPVYFSYIDDEVATTYSKAQLRPGSHTFTVRYFQQTDFHGSFERGKPIKLSCNLEPGHNYIILANKKTESTNLLNSTYSWSPEIKDITGHESEYNITDEDLQLEET